MAGWGKLQAGAWRESPADPRALSVISPPSHLCHQHYWLACLSVPRCYCELWKLLERCIGVCVSGSSHLSSLHTAGAQPGSCPVQAATLTRKAWGEEEPCLSWVSGTMACCACDGWKDSAAQGEAPAHARVLRGVSMQEEAVASNSVTKLLLG